MSREMIDHVWNQVCRNLPERMSAEELYLYLPFYMEYETKYDKKEKYNEIVKRLVDAQDYAACADSSCESRAWYLLALIDVMDNMSIEIYEQYRTLQDIFKRVLREVLDSSDNGAQLPVPTCVKVICAVLKGCSMGVLLKEKYEPVGRRMLEDMLQHIEEIFGGANQTGLIFKECLKYLEA